MVGVDGNLFLHQHVVLVLDHHLRLLVLSRRAETDAVHSPVCRLEVDSRVHGGVLASLDSLDRIPDLAELTAFARIDPAVVRLVVGISAHHQL